MFYEEVEMDGLWYWRGTPDGKWIPFGPEQYATKIRDLQQQLAEKRQAESEDAGT